MTPPGIITDGASLTCAGVAAVARDEAPVTVAAGAVAAARAAWETARDVAGRRPVYGRTTGVGANRNVGLADDDLAEHGLRLLRSHAAGSGPLQPADLGRAMLVNRLNQIVAGGSGVDPAELEVLADALNRGFTPPVPQYGAIGTGDLTALASLGLCLIGERAWRTGTGPPPRFPLRPAEALGFMSSNAATLGEAALACHDLSVLVRSAVVIAALSLLAVHGSLEPYAPAVHHDRPGGQQRVASRMRALLEGAPQPPARIQDSYGYRAFPQVHGPAADSLGYAARVVTAELNAASENPLVDPAGHAVWHNGNFHAAYAGLALDSARAALFQTAALSAARLGTLVEPSFTGLHAFAAEVPASSGIMILEYVAQSAVADLRRFASPAARGSAVLARGVEEHAGFSTQSARASTDAVAAYRAVLACELAAAVRVLRMQDRAPAAGGPLRAAFDAADAVLDPRTADRPLDADLTAAEGLLGGYAAFGRPEGDV
ncbi:MAG: histidine ammonia-lyase [Streptosporangiaceae bacterium]|nr:histidine ammonia-lyase [Streptosporangiaceae bacterium]